MQAIWACCMQGNIQVLFLCRTLPQRIIGAVLWEGATLIVVGCILGVCYGKLKFLVPSLLSRQFMIEFLEPGKWCKAHEERMPLSPKTWNEKDFTIEMFQRHVLEFSCNPKGRLTHPWSLRNVFPVALLNASHDSWSAINDANLRLPEHFLLLQISCCRMANRYTTLCFLCS